MNITGKFSKFLLSTLLTVGGVMSVNAQTATESLRYGTGLTEYGSSKPAYAIYTNPGPDCSTTMNVSWATPPGTKCEIELTDEATGKSYIYYYDNSFLGEDSSDGKAYKFPYVYRCDTFNDIPSKLSDKRSVIEKHIFDKHGFELNDLEPDKEYSYRIVTFNDKTGAKEYSDTYRFRTAGAPVWRAAIISDFHHYSPSWHRLESAMGMLDVIERESGGFDWVLSPGDQAAHGASFNFWTELAEQPNYKDFMWASVQGNHDNMASNKKTSDNFFRDSHFFPHNGYSGQEGIAYWFKYGDALFLMLNSEAMHQEEGVRRAVEWMEKTVKDNPSRYIIVVEHYNWLSGMTGSDFQHERFYEAFDRMGVDLAISGHNHVYLRTLPLKGNAASAPSEGTYYVVTSSSDNDRGREMKKPPKNADLIAKRWTEGPSTVGGMLMDVNPQRIQMTLYDRYGKIHDFFSIPAKK